MGKNMGIVEDFISAWGERDVDRVMGFFTPDAIYHNIPMEPLQGLDAIRGLIESFIGMASEIDWIVHSAAESADGRVLTERTDRFLIGEKWVEAAVMGIFELRDGRISAWRDYFDLDQFQKQMPQS